MNFFCYSSLRFQCQVICLILGSLCVAHVSHGIVFSLYVSQPGDMTSNLSGVLTETFDGADVDWVTDGGYDSLIGDYSIVSGVSDVIGSNIYGANTGDYLALDPSAVVNLDLDSDVEYFGFAWPAGDDLNQVTFLNDGQVLFVVRTADVTAFLDDGPVTAIDGSEYATADYLGQPPNGTANTAEYYAYLSVVATDGGVFDQVIFSHNRTSGKFETDNHSTHTTAPELLPTDWAYAYDSSDLIPEPSSYTMILGLTAIAFTLVRRRRG